MANRPTWEEAVACAETIKEYLESGPADEYPDHKKMERNLNDYALYLALVRWLS